MVLKLPSVRGRFMKLMIALMGAVLGFGLAVGATASAQAATLTVSPGTCTMVINAGPTSAMAAVFKLPSHANTNIRITTRFSWRWGTKDTSRGVVQTASQVQNHYNVKFLDVNGKQVWAENNAVPNGGSRVFYVGSNVRAIQVTTDYSYWTWAIGGGASLSW
ncbi:MAG: hypothetical protein FWF75_04150 [Propionibacteriaceae bacterium]|nr:hypothetical protein [Propionibacteriaceae bacterium]